MIVVLYSPKFDEIIVVCKTPACADGEFEVESSHRMRDAWAFFASINYPCHMLKDMDDWVFLGEL